MLNENTDDKIDKMMGLVSKNTKSEKPEKHLLFDPVSGDLVSRFS